jgi:hypothetical protein
VVCTSAPCVPTALGVPWGYSTTVVRVVGPRTEIGVTFLYPTSSEWCFAVAPPRASSARHCQLHHLHRHPTGWCWRQTHRSWSQQDLSLPRAPEGNPSRSPASQFVRGSTCTVSLRRAHAHVLEREQLTKYWTHVDCAHILAVQGRDLVRHRGDPVLHEALIPKLDTRPVIHVK